MIYLVHGDDFSKTRAAIVNQLKNKDKIDFVLSTESIKEINRNLNSADLFGKTPAITIDITGTDKALLESLIDLFKDLDSGEIEKRTIIVFSAKPLPKTNALVKVVAELKIKNIEFDTFPQSNVFNFVDALFNKNRVKAYKEYQNLKSDNQDDFYIFSMILWELRNIAQVKFTEVQDIKMSPNVLSKSKNHAELFSEEQVIKLFDHMYQTDMQVKTGEIPQSMFLLMNIEKILS